MARLWNMYSWSQWLWVENPYRLLTLRWRYGLYIGAWRSDHIAFRPIFSIYVESWSRNTAASKFMYSRCVCSLYNTLLYLRSASVFSPLGFTFRTLPLFIIRVESCSFLLRNFIYFNMPLLDKCKLLFLLPFQNFPPLPLPNLGLCLYRMVLPKY